jgi:hypothetical protein
VLRIPFRQAHEANVAAHVPSPALQSVLSILAAFGGIAVLLALFATPHGAQLAAEIPLSSFAPAPRVLDVRAKAANVEIIVIDTLATLIDVAHVSVDCVSLRLSRWSVVRPGAQFGAGVHTEHSKRDTS